MAISGMQKSNKNTEVANTETEYGYGEHTLCSPKTSQIYHQ